MLEPCDAKVSSTVLRGLGDRKVAWLLGDYSREVGKYLRMCPFLPVYGTLGMSLDENRVSRELRRP